MVRRARHDQRQLNKALPLSPERPAPRPALVMAGVLIAIVLTSYVVRIVTDVPFLVSATDPERRTSRAGMSRTPG
jgi:hypothetical protein